MVRLKDLLLTKKEREQYEKGKLGMSKIVIGCDPDSKKHGIAIYQDGKLINLLNASTLGLLDYIQNELAHFNDITAHVENVKAVSAAFNARERKSNVNVKLKMAQHVGMCKQSQTELERLFFYLNIDVVLHPISKRWKKEKAEFEKITGWTARSNEDTRSGAYFGFLGIK
mgnify:CR=1 FL=1